MESVEQGKLDEFFKRIYAVDSIRREQIIKDNPREIQVEPNLWYVIGDSGAIYAIYGSIFREELNKLHEIRNSNHPKSPSRD